MSYVMRRSTTNKGCWKVVFIGPEGNLFNSTIQADLSIEDAASLVHFLNGGSLIPVEAIRMVLNKDNDQ